MLNAIHILMHSAGGLFFCAVVQPAPTLSPQFGKLVESGPIEARKVFIETTEGPARGWVARVDLGWVGPGGETVDVVVSGPTPGPEEAVLVSTDRWAEDTGSIVAVNANFFAWLGEGKADIQGLSVSDSAVVSPPRVAGERPDPALLFIEKDGSLRADVEYTSETLPEGVVEAVAGIGPSGTSPIAGSMLVEDGQPTGWTARVEPEKRHPRTAAGVSRDGGTVYLAVIDGRQPGWSVGLTLPELAVLMRTLGAYEAINLDGGGSSAFVMRKEEAGGEGRKTIEITNRPSGGSFRAVANHLGFRIVGFRTVEPQTGDQRTDNDSAD